MLDDDCSFSPVSPAFLQNYHHVVFGTTARLLVSISGEKNGMQRCTVLDSAYLMCIQLFCKSTVSPPGNLSSFEEKGVTDQLVTVTLYFLYPQMAEHFTQNGFVNGRVICILSSFLIQ